MNANKTQIHIDFYACNSKFLNDLQTIKHSGSKIGLQWITNWIVFYILNIVFL